MGGRGSQGTVQFACCSAGPGSSNLGPGSGAINRALEQDVLDSLSVDSRLKMSGMTGGERRE